MQNSYFKPLKYSQVLVIIDCAGNRAIVQRGNRITQNLFRMASWIRVRLARFFPATKRISFLQNIALSSAIKQYILK